MYHTFINSILSLIILHTLLNCIIHRFTNMYHHYALDHVPPFIAQFCNIARFRTFVCSFIFLRIIERQPFKGGGMLRHFGHSTISTRCLSLCPLHSFFLPAVAFDPQHAFNHERSDRNHPATVSIKILLLSLDVQVFGIHYSIN